MVSVGFVDKLFTWIIYDIRLEPGFQLIVSQSSYEAFRKGSEGRSVI